ncbi:MAG: Gp49 family protein [Thalassospira sp.]|uniref:Gp49 family protein n=1 Tax=Thalassospira sp. TaxID=1912094 RepID=UPI003A86BD99
MTENEAQIEKEIVDKGLTAARITPGEIDDTILTEQYHVFPGTTLTVCALTLKNGFHVVGESACASPDNFDREIGRKIARDNARNQIWKLEGYRLRSALAEAASYEELIAKPADQ